MMKTWLSVLLVLVLVLAVQCISTAAELCYVGDGGHLYLRNISSSSSTKITPSDLQGGICRIPQWLDRNRILFIYDLKPDSYDVKTKVGILNVQTKKIEWIGLLGGSVTIGYDKASNKIDYMKFLQKSGEETPEAAEVYLGQYDLKTKKAGSVPAYGKYGDMTPVPIRRWPQPDLRLVPLATSDVSDQVGVFSPSKKKFVSVKWLTDDWKERHLDTFAVMALTPGPSGKLAVSAFTESDSGYGTTLYIILTSSDATARVKGSSAVIHGPSWLADGTRLAWWEEDFEAASKTVWISQTSGSSPQRIGSGWDPAWRP